MGAIAKEAKGLQPSDTPSAPNDKPLDQLLADQAFRLQFKTERVTSDGAGKITLALENADFNQLLQLLEQANRSGIRLLRAGLRSATSPRRAVS